MRTRRCEYADLMRIDFPSVERMDRAPVYSMAAATVGLPCPVRDGRRCSSKSAVWSSAAHRSSGQFDPSGLKRRAHSRSERCFRLPSELVAGAGDVQAGTLHLAEACLCERRLEVVATALLLEDRDNVEHACLATGADVDRPADGATRGGGEGRVDDVADEHVVAPLAAVAVERRAPAVHEPAAEDRDHAGLAERVLTRAVDVAVAERDGAEAVEARVEVAVLLGAELAGAVAGHRRGRRALRAGDLVDVAVDGAAGARVHEAGDVRAARRL